MSATGIVAEAIRFFPLNFSTICGEVVHRDVHYLFGCGYAAFGPLSE